MTGWDILADIIKIFPPFAAAALFVAAGVIFIVGFTKRGINFIKYGFGQTALDNSLEKRFDRLEGRLDGMDTRLDGMNTRLAAIETNHFGHLKDFLTELTSILLDKDVINNQDKARLDNKLRGM